MRLRSKEFRFGIFILVASVALLTFLAVVTSEQLLKSTNTYFVAFENTSVFGLEKGASVNYLGLKVGTIQDIYIADDNINRIVVELKVAERVPIKSDAYADIVNMGITGLKMIEIRGGSNDAPKLESGDYIQPDSTITGELTERAGNIAEKIEDLLDNLNNFADEENMNKLSGMMDQASVFFSNVNDILERNDHQFDEILQATSNFAEHMDSVSNNLNQMVSELNQIVSSDTVEQILVNTRDISLQLRRAKLLELIKNLADVVEKSNRILTQMDERLLRGSESFERSMIELQQSLHNVNAASRMISEDPSVLLRGAKPKNSPDKKLEH
ncbi:MAG: MlaD family protein [Calditrichia bacterium]